MANNNRATTPCIARYSSIDDVPDSVHRDLAYRTTEEFFGSIEWFDCLLNYGFRETPRSQFVAGFDRSHAPGNSYLLCLREDAKRKRLRGLTNFYTLRFPGFGGPSRPSQDVVDRIFSTLLSDGSVWNEIELCYLSPTCPNTGMLYSALISAGWRVGLFHQCWNYFVDVRESTFDDYWSARSSRLRNTVRRKARRASARYCIRTEIFRESGELSTGLADYERVYARSWKQPETSVDFVPALIRLCADLGILRLGILYLDDIPAAAQIWIVAARKASIYKLAHNAEFDSLSVGSLLTAYMFEQAIDVDQALEIDFGIGDEAYKTDWMRSRRQLVCLQAINPRSVGGLCALAKRGLRGALGKIGLREHTPVQAHDRYMHGAGTQSTVDRTYSSI